MKFEGNKELPSLEFVENEGYLKIWGRCISLTAREDFWNVLIEKMKEYLEEPKDIIFDIDLIFFSTVSAKSILDLLKIMQEKIKDNNKNLTVNWIYEDEDGLEAGENYFSILNKIDWKFIKK